MGRIIDLQNGRSEPPEVLTETEPSGLRTSGYLAHRPAIDAVEADETVQFVLTNREQGIAIRSGTTKHALPDREYQTVVVVTDRRVIALIGMSSGDREFALDVSEVTAVRTTTGRRTGRLTIERADGPTWVVHTGTDGLTAVADYLRAESDACSRRRGRGTAESIRGFFEATMDTAKSFERDQVAKLLPAVEESSLGTDGGEVAEPPTPAPESDGADTEPSRPDTGTAIDQVTKALAKTDWRARGARERSPFDLLAERPDERVGVVVHDPEDGALDRGEFERCAAITGAAGTDAVMLATTGTVRGPDARSAASLGVRLRSVATLGESTAPPAVAALTGMASDALVAAGWSVRTDASGPFDLLADHGDDLLGVVVHVPEDGPVEDRVEHCGVVTGAAGTDTVMLVTTGTVRDGDERLADELGVRLVTAEELAGHLGTDIGHE